MKLFTHKIWIIVFSILVVTTLKINAQNEIKLSKTFVRIYSNTGKKIEKGKIVYAADSVLVLKRGTKRINVNVSDIGYIKTKRSAGHNVLMGTVTGAAIGIVSGVSSADPDAIIFNYSAGEGALVFGTLGAIGGAGLGGIASLFKKFKMYIINGDKEKWKNFIEDFKK